MAYVSDINGISPNAIVETINGDKMSKVIVEEVVNGELCNRASSQSMDGLLSIMFDKSIEFRIIGIQVYRFQDCNYAYLLLMRSKDFTTNIDAEMLAAISRIEFDKGDRND